MSESGYSAICLNTGRACHSREVCINQLNWWSERATELEDRQTKPAFAALCRDLGTPITSTEIIAEASSVADQLEVALEERCEGPESCPSLVTMERIVESFSIKREVS